MRSLICLELPSRKPSWPAFNVRARNQAGHMGASDLIKALQNTLRGGGRPHTGNVGYHGLRRKHLQTSLDEFVFRFNRRRARHAAFRSLLGIAAAHSLLSYKKLILPETKA